MTQGSGFGHDPVSGIPWERIGWMVFVGVIPTHSLLRTSKMTISGGQSQNVEMVVSL